MTTFTTDALRDAGHRPGVPWRRLTWVIWRQHRVALAGTVALLGGLGLLMLVSELQAHAANLGLASCHKAGGCAEPTYFATYGSRATTVAIGLAAIPILIGVFIGGPLIARELETGTFRFAWTQECGRFRLVTAKLASLAVLVTAGAAGLSLVTAWYFQPFITAGLVSGIRPEFFNVRGVDFAAWTLVAFMIAALAGVVIKRTIPAMASALAVSAGLMFATAFWLRPHYQDPLTGSTSAVTVRWWVVGTARAGAAVTYQPEARFWHFQFVEGGGLVALALLLGAATIWLACRRAE
jgi:hypothetical protein